MIAGEHDPAGKGETQMVDGVARRVQTGQLSDPVAMTQLPGDRGNARSEAFMPQDGGAKHVGKHRRSSAMIGMPMRQQNGLGAPIGGLCHGTQMRRICWTWIQHHHPVRHVDQIGIGAVIGHRTGIRRHNTAYPGDDRQRDLTRGNGLDKESHRHLRIF
ncbi:hypothetical protein AQY21_21735 [Paracoccus sp. MKU1]|nr:hypothetical protein AQY21_21735 [Paracoccus sp. MKU1]